MNIEEYREFKNIIKPLEENCTVQEMKQYRQHCNTSCYEHCYWASYYCYRICKKLKLDYKSATRAAMLHDLFLYDWRIKGSHEGLHAFNHGRIARDNACKLFELNEKEKDIIHKHMWPTTPIPPKYIEGFILTIVDKYCALKETFKYILEKARKSKIYKYAYIILGIILLEK